MLRPDRAPLPALLGLCLWTMAHSSYANDPPGAAKPQATPTPGASATATPAKPPPGPTPAAADTKRAEALFQKARALKKQGKTEEACDLFAESQALDPNGGTLVNLAECHEAEGKTGSAWRELHGALKFAEQAEDKDLVKALRARISAIVPALYELTIRIPRDVASIPGVSILLDDVPIAADLPTHFRILDPGRHTLHASAPGHVELYRDVTLAGQTRKATILVRLEPIAPPPPPSYAPFIGFTVSGGLGLVGAVALSVFAASHPTQPELWIGVPLLGALTIGMGVAAGFSFPRDPAAPPAPNAPAATQSRLVSPRLAITPLVSTGLLGLGATGTF